MDNAAAQTPDRKHRSRLGATLRALVRARVTTGLITILPVVVTVWLVMVVFGWLRDASLWILDAFLLSPLGRGLIENWGVTSQHLDAEGLRALPRGMRWGISIFAVLLTIGVLYFIGLIAANVLGRRMIGWFDTLVARVPIVKSIYSASKQILQLFSGQATQQFQRVALVPFPNDITRSVAFITNSFKDSVTGEELCACFVATTPNPTTGFVFVLRRADVIEVDWSVEEAIKVVMSGGILSPGYVTMATGLRPPPAAPPPADLPLAP
jgi:uncharacterized membrane protein